MPPSHTPEPHATSRGHGSRSQSPYRQSRADKKHTRDDKPRSTRRSRSPRRDDDHKHRHKRHRSRTPPPKRVVLPYKAKPLSKRDFDEYKPLFQSYLDIQKQIQLDELDERESKGRWKSFVSRWNRGELARSWYDPSMLQTAQETVAAYREEKPAGREPERRVSPEYGGREENEEESDEDEFGPAPPKDGVRRLGHGPTIPKMHDLTYRNEVRDEDRARDGAYYAEDIRHERKTDRRAQKERLEELVPRADPGSRERQLEKKRETTSTLQSFRDAKEGGDVELGESDLMGDDGIDGYKKQKKEAERKKSEREIRREEIARARDAEREEKLSERRAKEGKTMDFLMQIAKERFG